MLTTKEGTPISMEQCIKNCKDCHDLCLAMIAYCLEMGGKYTGATHICLMLDCAEICQTSANFMLRGSDLHGYTCGICAEFCQRCAQLCESFGDNAQMQECAKTCWSCAESCHQMAVAMSR